MLLLLFIYSNEYLSCETINNIRNMSLIIILFSLLFKVLLLRQHFQLSNSLTVYCIDHMSCLYKYFRHHWIVHGYPHVVVQVEASTVQYKLCEDAIVGSQ